MRSVRSMVATSSSNTFAIPLVVSVLVVAGNAVGSLLTDGVHDMFDGVVYNVADGVHDMG